jgi:hypothetical protein
MPELDFFFSLTMTGRGAGGCGAFCRVFRGLVLAFFALFFFVLRLRVAKVTLRGF